MTAMIPNRFFKLHTLVPLAVVAFALVFTACADVEVSTSECEDGGELWTEYRLFMGRGDGDREVVSDAEWDAFLADTITPRFPDGLSVFDVAGQGERRWNPERNAPRCCWLAPQGGALTNEQIGRIQAAFNRTLLRVITEACVAFK